MSKEKVHLPVVSYSKITSYKHCPKKYKFAYIDKMERAPSPYADFGNFCHEILESFHKKFLKTKPEQTDAKKAMVEIFKTALDKYKEKLTKEQVDEGYEIMKIYLKQILENMPQFPNVISLEEKIWQSVDNELNFYGFIDRLQKDDDGVIHVMDYKTTKQKRYLKDRTQLILYAYFVYLKDPTIDKIRTSYILLRHKMALMTEEHDVSTLIKTKNKFVDDWKVIKEEKLYRPNPRFDTCTICDYAEHCKEGRELLQRRKGFYGEEAGW